MTNLSSFSSSSKPAHEAILVKIAEFFAPRAADGETVFSLPDFVENSGAINSQDDFNAMLRAIDMAALMGMEIDADARNGSMITLRCAFFANRIPTFELSEKVVEAQLVQFHTKFGTQKTAENNTLKASDLLQQKFKKLTGIGGIYQGDERRHYPEQRNQEQVIWLH